MISLRKSFFNLSFILLVAMIETAWSQGPEIFGVSDFDLKGPVKSCVVITGYGQEEFTFDKKGRLIKTKTMHSNTDYEITYYKYGGQALIERRDEVYRDNTFDRVSSMAYIYSLDTLGTRKLTESIISYARVNMEQFEYYYDPSNRVSRIVRTDNSGVDETFIERDTTDTLAKETHILNDKPVKAILKSLDSSTIRNKVTLTLFEGEAQQKTEIEVDSAGRLIKEIEWSLPKSRAKGDPFKTDFKERVEKQHEYDENGFLLKTITTRGKAVSEQDFVHQLDGSEYQNWIKQIVTPKNSYITRKITYYSNEVDE